MGDRFVKLDENFHTDDKILLVGLEGAGLYAKSLTLARQIGSSGALQRVQLQMLGGSDELIDRCVDAGLYVQVDADDAGGMRAAMRKDALRIAAWAKRNSDVDMALSSDRGKLLAHQRHHVQGGKPNPAECAFCREEPQVDAGGCGPHAQRMHSAMRGRMQDLDLDLEREIPPSGSAGPERQSKADPFETDFAEVWAAYPLKRERKGALVAYQATRRRGVTAAELLAATGHYVEDLRATGALVKHGKTWFGPKEPWRDYVDGIPAGSEIVGQTHEGGGRRIWTPEP